MNRMLLLAGGLLNLSLAIFKIAMPYLFHMERNDGSERSGHVGDPVRVKPGNFVTFVTLCLHVDLRMARAPEFETG